MRRKFIKNAMVVSTMPWLHLLRHHSEEQDRKTKQLGIYWERKYQNATIVNLIFIAMMVILSKVELLKPTPK